jgi:hypothetical protein
MANNGTISCTAQNGSTVNFDYYFTFDRFEGRVIWDFSVFPAGIDSITPFSFALTIINESIAKVTVMDRNNMEVYRAKGIPEAMIILCKKLTTRNILSSSNHQPSKLLPEEFRTPPATKVWERLKKNNLANYNEHSDTYHLV